MATVDELVEQYQKDPELQKEIAKITEDNKITSMEFLTFIVPLSYPMETPLLS